MLFRLMIVFAMLSIRYLQQDVNKDCFYNLVSFARNYFASAVCYCYQTDKNLVCRHCKQLFYDLNFDTMKICIREKDLMKEIELMETDLKCASRQIKYFSI